MTGGRDAQQASQRNPFLAPADGSLKRLQRKRSRAEEPAFVTPEVSRAQTMFCRDDVTVPLMTHCTL